MVTHQRGVVIIRFIKILNFYTIITYEYDNSIVIHYTFSKIQKDRISEMKRWASPCGPAGFKL
jgi:hypothetical protein